MPAALMKTAKKKPVVKADKKEKPPRVSTGRKCSICTHAKVKEINSAIAKGDDSFRVISDCPELQIGAVFIYGIYLKNKLIYIGSTSRGIQIRFDQHIYQIQSGKHCNRRLTEMVLKGGIENCFVDLIETVCEECRFEREYFHIKNETKNGHKLTNVVSSLTQQEYIAESRKLQRQQTLEVLDSITHKSILICEYLYHTCYYENYCFVCYCQEMLQEFFVTKSRFYLKLFGDEVYCKALARLLERPTIAKQIGLVTAIQKRGNYVTEM